MKSTKIISKLALISLWFSIIPSLVIAQVKLDPRYAPGNLEAQDGSSLSAIQKIIGNLIAPFLQIAGGVAIFFIVYAGFQWITAMGSTEKLEKAKKTMTWAILGFAVILVSYLLVQTVVKIFYEELPS